MRKVGLIVIGLLLCSGAATSHAITIEFDYRYDNGFFDDPARRARLEQAASFFTFFTDSLTTISPEAGDTWSVIINNPSNLGMLEVLTDQEVAADTLRIFVGGASMGPSVLGFGSTGTLFDIDGSDEFEASLFTRGQQNALGATATDYGVWGGVISVNSDKEWYFGESADGLGANQHDFLTTAVHEIAHIFGFGSADSWFSQIVTGPDGTLQFEGAASMALFGGPVPLENSAHWLEGLFSEVAGEFQETLMDPSTPAGERQLMTALDYAGLNDIGWETVPVPVPAAFWLLLSALGGWAWTGRSAQKTSHAA
ncbi:MAG: PEP-CTERM sorting domain-containing protein [Pseudomonadota bacterium]